MKSSCIQHPPNEPLIIIRQWQLEACEGNACAAALLSFFEYWHNIKIEQSRKAGQQNAVAEQHGDEGTQDTSLLQFHNEDELEAGVLIYKRDTIRAALKLLEALKFITVQPNPNPKYAFDKTRYFGFQDGAVARWLKNRLSSPKSRSRSRKNQAPSPINPAPITETTSETTSDKKEPTARKRAGGIKTELPEWMPVAVWERWLLYRQEIKHPVAVSAIPAMLSRLDRFRQDGHSPVEVIEQTMANSWRGLFELPERNGNGNGKHQSDVKKPSNAERVRRNLARFGVEFPPHDSGSNTHGVS